MAIEVQNNAYIDRAYLFDDISLNQLPRVVIITAPAGYGKTVFAQQFLEFVDFDFVWHQLDRWQQDISNLHERAILGLEKVAQGISEAVPAVQDARQSAHQITTYLHKALNTRCIYVFDDTHHLHENSAIWLQTFIDTAPESLTFVLAGRTTPSLRWSNVVLKGGFAGFETKELRFTVGDLQTIGVSKRKATSLITKLDGWIAGIKLALDKGAGKITQLALGEGQPEIVLFNALADELFTHLPIDLQNIVLASSTVEILTPDLAQIVGIKDFSTAIYQMLRRNLYLQEHPDGGYVFHELFRTWLQEKLQATKPTRFANLHYAAGKYFEQKDRMLNAVWHYVKSGRSKEAIEIAEKIAREYFIHGKRESLLIISNLLDAYTVPLLHLYCAIIYTDRNNFDKSDKHLRRAREGFQEREDIVRVASTQLQQAVSHQRQGQYTQAIELARQVADDKQAVSAIKAWANRIQGSVYLDIGHYEQAIKHLKHALSILGDDGTSHEHAHYLQDLGSAYLRTGQFEEARNAINTVIMIRRSIANPSELASAMNSLGFYYHCCSQYAEAADIIQDGLKTIRDSQSITAAYLNWSLGDIQRDIGQYEQAESSYEMALNVVESSNNTLYHGIVLSMARLRIWQGRNEDVVEWLALAQETIQPSRNILLHLTTTATKLTFGLLDQNEIINDNIIIDSIDRLVERNAYIKVAQLLGIYWIASIRALNEQLLRHVERILDRIGTHTYQPIAATIVNMDAASDIENYRHRFPELFRLIDNLQIIHKNTRSNPSRLLVKAKIIHVKLLTLGQEQVIYNNEPISNTAWRISLSRELFFYLYFCGKQFRHEIVLNFWPDHSDKQVRRIFHNTLHRTRDAIKDGIIYVDRYYMINPDFVVEWDAHRFQDYVKRAQPLTRIDARTEDLYRKAIELYQGELLPAISSDWVVSYRRRFQNLYLEVLSGLGDCQQSQQRYLEAGHSYEKAFTLMPANEDIARKLMACYARMAKKNQIQDVFDRLKSHLEFEYGITPEQDTRKLLYKLLS